MKTLITKQVLQRARKLITKPECWTTGEFARRANGEGTYSMCPTAVSWCAAGAINKVSRDVNRRFSAKLMLESVMGISVAQFNDNSSHEDVLAAFDIAICLES